MDMVRVFGVANHSPEVVIRALIKAKRATVQEIGILPVGYVLTAKKPAQSYLMFLTTRDLMHNLAMLQTPKYAECSAIVFANPMKLAELHGIQPLDFEPNPDYQGFGFTLKNLDMSRFKSYKGSDSVVRHNGRYLEKLVHFVQQGSLLNPLMTLIYTMPSVMQNAVKAAAIKWLYFGKTDPYLDKYFDEIDGSVTKRVRQKFKEILFTEVGRNFQAAFKSYRTSKTENLVKLSKQFCVSDYEMRYILSVVRGLDKRGFTDSFDKAKNRKKHHGKRS